MIKTCIDTNKFSVLAIQKYLLESWTSSGTKIKFWDVAYILSEVWHKHWVLKDTALKIEFLI